MRAETTAAAKTIKEAEARIQQDDLPGALGVLDEGLARLPDDDRSVLWEHDFAGLGVHAVPLTYFVHTALFTVPVLRDGRLFVGCRDGGLYAFDVERIIR